MTKIIAVTGATGVQGGSIARAILKTPGWSVRAITRNPDSDAAKELASLGATVVKADIGDESSLAKAFEGVHAIFALTDFWGHLFAGNDQKTAGEIEKKEGLTMAKVASTISTLEDYIWSTLPPANEYSKGKYPIPHFDYKAEVDAGIRSQYPELAKKTTLFWVASYPSNFAYFPHFKPVQHASGKYVCILSTPGSALVPLAGDMNVNPGLWVKAILANPQKTRGKFVFVVTETLTWDEAFRLWSEVTGKQAKLIHCSTQEIVDLWGVSGKELDDQLQWSVHVPDWTVAAKVDYVSAEELGVTGAIGTKDAWEALKTLL